MKRATSAGSLCSLEEAGAPAAPAHGFGLRPLSSHAKTSNASRVRALPCQAALCCPLCWVLHHG